MLGTWGVAIPSLPLLFSLPHFPLSNGISTWAYPSSTRVIIPPAKLRSLVSLPPIPKVPVELLSPFPPTVTFRYPISLCPLASVHGPIQAVHSSSFRPVHSPSDLCYESPSLVANLARVMQSGVTSSDPQTTCGVKTIPILPLPLSATPFTLRPMALVHRPVRPAQPSFCAVCN
ncbi:hypothetical protein F5J12DRAFT_786101 [Pisolithus orientalis]|uniref:uncharacterized protein n=1 Tax=Pisolithus orientalis TaxID=936130 RepID=UPI00222554C1|nr:uncharacterized protein F5J12DRAFT_786101 [Pisolithus orientalis]KAI5992570.1 hypothetical protein F5J12DRAFT_786101 [Pisolithus orientalis]